MSTKFNKLLNTVNARILLVVLALFVTITIVIGIINDINIQNLYKKTYTDRLLLTNAMMGSIIQSEDVEYFINLLKNQGEEFRQHQVDFFHDREELFRLQEEGASEEEQQKILDRLAVFHAETQSLKNDTYWDILAELKKLKEISRSTYVYVMADIGLKNRDGEPLFTYIFDAEDAGKYGSPDMDGLGTSDIGNEAFTNVFLTKKQTENAEHYVGDFGELYFVCVPILNENGDVIAVLGTDLSLDEMNEAVTSSVILFDVIIIAVFIVSVILIVTLLNRRIAYPLSSLTETAIAFAEGNLHTPISEYALKQKTEIGTLANAFKTTLDATTLYLNSIPESIFIMNRRFETYFRNEQYIKCFGYMPSKKFTSALFPDCSDEEIKEKLKTALQNESSLIAWFDDTCFSVLLKEIAIKNTPENSILVIANNITDLVREKENAQAAAEAKSMFLSRMSHEMRTPMNAIIGMAKVAEDTDSISGIKHCLSTINASSEQLLSIINDVLDMSKIDAGKLELENVPINIEKTLMKVYSIVADLMEKRNQKFNVILNKGLKLHYIADDLRLSQVLTNLLSNAAKFTPENGSITLSVETVERNEKTAVLRFSVTDTGIGMTEEQVSRLFSAFEQADGSITRKFGGTGLGLAISHSIVEKMGGSFDVKSELGKGTTFSFTVKLECAAEKEAIIFDGISPEDIKTLVIESDDEIRERFSDIIENFGIDADIAKNKEEALAFLESTQRGNAYYDIIFISYELSDANGIEIIKEYSEKINKNTVIIITSYSEWHKIEKIALQNNITHHITKPIFPSSVLDTINEIVGGKVKSLDITTEVDDEIPDLSGVKILLAEDIEINREIFLALIEGTNVVTEIAENGVQAVEKFKEKPDFYDLIIMDIQMPEMDGFEATKSIRELDLPRAKTIPIIAMSANAFKEDIENCLASGMNDHLAKPIDIDVTIKKIAKYVRTEK